MWRAFTVFAAVAGVAMLVVAGYVAWIVQEAPDAKTFRNASAAMDSTLLTGDRFTVIRYRDANAALAAAKFGLVVAHAYPPEPSKQFVKRLVGLPGDTLAMVAGRLRRNGRTVDEPYAWHEEPLDGPDRTRNDWGPLVVPDGKFFVLGDNRDSSLDSRYWGFVAADQLLGEVGRVYFSRDPATGAIRWRRFGLKPNAGLRDRAR